MRVQGTRNGEVSTLVSVEGTMRQGRGSAEGVGARSGKGLHSTKDGNPWVGVRTGARHADGRYTDMIWREVVARRDYLSR
jgi:hypothetical protein